MRSNALCLASAGTVMIAHSSQGPGVNASALSPARSRHRYASNLPRLAVVTERRIERIPASGRFELFRHCSTGYRCPNP
jgi:hypothetical protein